MAKLELTYRLDISDIKKKIEKLRKEGNELVRICNVLLRSFEEIEDSPIKFEVMKTPEKEITVQTFDGETSKIEIE